MNTNDLANRLKFLREKQTTHSPMSAQKSISVLPTATTNAWEQLKLLAEFYDTSLDYLVDRLLPLCKISSLQP